MPHTKNKIANPVAHAALYLIGIAALIAAHKTYPTSLAGPGLDLLVLLLFAGCIIGFLIYGCFDKQIARETRETNLCVHVIGFVLILCWMMTS